MIEDLPLECTPILPDTQAFSQKLENTPTFDNGWGTLLPIICEGDLKITVLTEDCYSVGRSPVCNITLTSDKITSTLLAKISKIHFKLLKSSMEEEGKNIIYLEDLSSNGTFVNGVKVGKNEKILLTSADEISLATPHFRVFMFVDRKKTIEQWLTPELCTKFLVLRHLGTGGFGDVKLVIDKKTFHKYAMKKVENDKEREQVIFNEVNILKRLKHPCIINFEDIYETPSAVFIALEYMPSGNLLQRINEKQKIPEAECKIIFYQLTLGVKYLHDEGIVHRDMKPENVLIDVKGKRNDVIVKITDFGLSKIVHSATNLKTACGTLRYTAPEIIKITCGNYSSKVDVWSLGIILHYCLGGELPFINCLNTNHLALAILKGSYTMPPHRWHLISQNAVNLVKHMLKVKPEERISTSDIITHKWFQDPGLKFKIQELVGDRFLNFNYTNDDSSNVLQCCNYGPKRLRLE